ncbi:hypothetical protein [Mariniflexile sp. HMF6888]|uniref:hypothetical protein n=1 Tax=Mariniflexile sp. HMF6888 TaxID=3373086 RepID=UPI0037B5BB9F
MEIIYKGKEAETYKKSPSKPSEVSIWIDSYDDLFSDFDPMPYSERTLSDDFIIQVKKMVRKKGEKLSKLNLLLIEQVRSKQDEATIAKRLHEHFQMMAGQLGDDIRKTNRRGFILTVSGIICMIIASYISFVGSEQYVTHMLRVLFEPAGWFMVWAGLDKFVYDSKKTKKELLFYLKMVEVKVEFSNYLPAI